MNTLGLQLVGIVSAIALILPPGWCSASMQHDRAEPVPTTCCHPTQDQAPAGPTVECCCSRATTLPEKSVQVTGTPDLAPASVADVPVSDFEEQASETPFRSGPRLHVLKCVWRC